MKRLSEEKIRTIVEMRQKGIGLRTIARDLKINLSTVKDYAKRYCPDTCIGEPPQGELNRVVDRMDVDGSLEVMTMGKPATLEELAKAYKLDRTRWVEQFLRTNIWEGFYKLRNWLPDSVIERLVKIVREGGDAKQVRDELMSTQVGHQKVKLYQTRATYKRIVENEVEEAMRAFVEEHVPPAPLKRLPSKSRVGDRRDKKFVVSWGIWDAHLGMHAWRNEVGEDYDLGIAKKRVINSIDDMVTELSSYNIERVWMPVGNDWLHCDSVRNKTTFGDHTLDVDTRYQKMVDAGLACLVHMCERALEITDKLDVLWIPGNHDYSTSYMMCLALSAWFRNENRISVDLGAQPRKYRAFGGTLVGFDHGKIKPDKYPLLMVSPEARKVCQNPTYREMQIGHTHQRRELLYQGVTPTNGVLVRTNPALTSVDKWHFDNGFIGEEMKSVEAWRYDEVGYKGSHVCWARD